MNEKEKLNSEIKRLENDLAETKKRLDFWMRESARHRENATKAQSLHFEVSAKLAACEVELKKRGVDPKEINAKLVS